MKYNVRLEFNVISTDFADIEVDAPNPEEAIELAIEKYEEDGEADFYKGNAYSSTLADNIEEWIVEVL